MGWQLREHVERYAPDDLTHRELHVLSVLAGDARATGPKALLCEPYSVELAPRMRLGSPAVDDDGELSPLYRRQLKAVLSALVRKGALSVKQRGQKGRVAVYRLNDYGIPIAQGSEFETPEPVIAEPQGALIETPETRSGVLNPVVRGPKSGPPLQYQVKTPQPPAHEPQPPLTTYAVPGEGEGSPDSDNRTDRLVAVAGQRLAADDALPMTRREQTDLRSQLARALLVGWRPSQLEAELERPTAGLTNPARGLVARIKARAEDAPADVAAPAKLPREPWCGDCDSDGYRMVEDEPGRWGHCPRCSVPAVRARQQATA